MNVILNFCALFLTASCLFAGEAPSKEKHTFEATYPEGFGCIFQKEMLVKKIPKDPSAKADLDRYYLVIPGEKELLVELQGWQEEEDAILAKAFADTTTAKLLVAGYESIESSGSPGLSQSAPKEATEWIPANYGWNVKKVIYLMSIKVLPSEPEKMEKK